MTANFQIASLPELYFGSGKLSILPDKILAFGPRVLLVTGAGSFISSIIGQDLFSTLEKKTIEFTVFRIPGEPSPAMIDDAVISFEDRLPDCVVAIGGGSVLDAGKAISAMLPLRTSVRPYLEGIGTANHPGSKIPFIAVPTTSGTGSEATKNAVLSEVGNTGYKRSLRHNNFVPDVAVIDPDLTISCSPAVTAASGMDAFTQLLEAHVSIAANPITDALSLRGLELVSDSLMKAFRDGSDKTARAGMALASYLSGVCLANAGLGLVHGFASSIGGWYAIPHGQICSALMPETNKATVAKLRKLDSGEYLSRYANVAKCFVSGESKTDSYNVDAFIDLQFAWREELGIPRLGKLMEHDLDRIATASENKNNPAVLDVEEKLQILLRS